MNDAIFRSYGGGMDDDSERHLMPRERRPYGFPVSRDWEDIDCKAVGCEYNHGEKCMTPSICKIGEEGRCVGFKVKPIQIGKKPDGD